MSLQQKKNGAFRTLAGLKYMDSQEIGSIMAYAGASVPVGYLSCDGQEVSKATYSGLYAIIGDTWGTATSTDNFKLPNLNNGSFLEGGVAGTYKDAGLPNIKGSSNYVLGTKNASNTGAIKLTNSPYDVVTSAAGSGDTRNFTTLSFNASDSNSIYSDSITTVQPKSACVKYCIRYMKTTNTILTLNEIKTAMVDMLYPVNSRYVQLDGMPEPTTFGGTWEVDTTYNGKALWVDSTQALGTSISAELPNIKGWISSCAGYGANAHLGAIQEGWIGSHRYSEVGSGTNIGNTTYTFSADLGQVNADGSTYVAQADSVYKNGGKVQPPAITCKVWKRTA